MKMLTRTRKKQLLQCLLFAGAAAGLYVLLCPPPVPPLMLLDKDFGDEGGPRIILAWTAFFGNEMTHKRYIEDDGCGELNCRLTSERGEVENAHAVLFHVMADFQPYDLPKYRYPRQRYVMLAHESADFEYPHIRTYDTPIFHDFFNWTMTMRSFSDVPAPYAVIGPDPKAAITAQQLEDSIATYFGKKTTPLAWFVSHCHTTAKREKIVALLQKHIQVDVYGGCGTTGGCPREEKGCEERLLNDKYFFHLALENSVCNDYVTEKYLWRYNYWSIPIVLSRSVMEGMAPPDSFIAVEDFANPLLLARHLHGLIANRTAYLQYFRWKLKGYSTVKRLNGSRYGFCGLCERLLKEGGGTHKSYWNMDEWWFGASGCRGPALALSQIRSYYPTLTRYVSPSLLSYFL